MDRRDALAKATIDTTGVGAAGLLPLEVQRRFIVQIKDSTAWSQRISQTIVLAPTGQLNKFNTSARIIRKADENSDDGYRVGANFPTVAYATVKVRLPWEVTEDVYHENIAGATLEATITNDMTNQFGLDLADLEVSGDETSGNAFLQINRGVLRELAVNGLHRVDGSTINAGVFVKDHYFAMVRAMPNKYKAQGGLVWIMSPNRHIDWIETMTDRLTAAGDSALIASGEQVSSPLGIPIFEMPFWDDTRVVLADLKNFRRIISWGMRRRRVTGETDAQLAALDKRFYIFFLKHDFIVEEHDAVVDLHTLDAI